MKRVYMEAAVTLQERRTANFTGEARRIADMPSREWEKAIGRRVTLPL